MDNKEKRGFHPIYILAVLYVAAVYLFPLIFGGMSQNTTGEQDISIWPLLIPFAFGLINLFVVIGGRNRIERVQLLNCAVFIKYALIPFYIIGGLCIALMILLMFTPVVIMVFVGPVMAAMLSTLGWIAMVGAASYSIGYIVKSCKQGVHGKVLSVIAGICQFFFTADVISIMVLALKEKKCVKMTIALLILFVLAIITTAVIVTGLVIRAIF